MTNDKIRIFYSYSHKDESLRDALETHLSILKRQNLVEEWHDRKIRPGDSWESEIDTNIDKADIVLLLVSSDFIASDYCYGKELQRVLEKHESDQTRVVPLIVRPVDWQSAPFAKFQALPKDGIPVTSWQNVDEAWVDIAKGLRRVIDEIRTRKSSLICRKDPIIIHELLKKNFERIELSLEKKEHIGGSSTGFVELDNIIDGIHDEDVILIAGRPSVGKTDFALNIALHLAKEATPIVFFSMRLPSDRIINRILAIESEIPIYSILRGKLKGADWPKLAYATGTVTEKLIFIDDNPMLTDIELAEKIDKLKQNHDLRFIVIDGIEHIFSVNRNIQKNTEVASIANSLKTIARKYNIPILLTINASRNVDLRVDKRPRIRDLDEWEILATETSNIVIFLYRDEIYNPDKENNRGIAEIIVAKNDYGPTNTTELAYLSEFCAFKNLYRE